MTTKTQWRYAVWANKGTTRDPSMPYPIGFAFAISAKLIFITFIYYNTFHVILPAWYRGFDPHTVIASRQIISITGL